MWLGSADITKLLATVMPTPGYVLQWEAALSTLWERCYLWEQGLRAGVLISHRGRFCATPYRWSFR